MLPDNFRDKNICVIGLGYVGLTLAVTMADLGFNVLGVEIRDEVLEKLSRGESHFHEPGINDMLSRTVKRKTFTFAKYIPEDCAATVYIITVGTPLGADHRARMDMIENVANEVKSRLKPHDLVILRSTVKPGTTETLIKPILEQANVSFDIAFCPERTLEGKALQELRELPQIVGGIGLSACIRAGQVFQQVTPTVVRVSDVKTAELIKLIDNANRDVRLAYANEVARVCDAVGVSAIEVINAGKLGYSRTNIPIPGPVGGPCLEKDPYILAEGLEPHDVVPDISLTARKLNESLPAEAVQFLASRIAPNTDNLVISVMGIAFKGWPATDDLRGSMAKPLLEALKKTYPSAEYRGFDFVVADKDISAFGLSPCESIEAAFCNANIVIIMNNHPDFGSIPITALSKQLAKPGVVYDFWNFFQARNLEMEEGTHYLALGSHNIK